jgi:NADH dehydrogenase
MNHHDVLIIGGGPAGRVIVHALHTAERDLSVALVKDESINVNRCAVPYGIAPDKPLTRYLIPNELVTDFGAELIIDRVVSIDPAGNAVTLAGGEKITYDRLVLATGARPIVPSIPGVEGQNVTTVRSRDDLARLRELGMEHKRAVIVGGGYIGVEVAVVLRRLGLEVAIVEMLPHVVQLTTEEEFLADIEADLTARGVRLFTSARAEEFLTSDGAVRGVRLGDGTIVDADFVVLSIGVVPNVELAAEAGLETSRLGIVTDDRLRTSVPNIYASGDCAEKKSFITGRPTRGEFGTNAVFMSRVIAANIIGADATFPGVINANASATFDCSFGSAGLIEQAASTQGLSIVTGVSEVLDRYPMMDRASPIRTKLVFEAETSRLIGGSVLRRGHATAANVDFISFAIQMGATIDDLLRYQYATHPELAAKPSDNSYVFAAKAAKDKSVAVAV